MEKSRLSGLTSTSGQLGALLQASKTCHRAGSCEFGIRIPVLGLRSETWHLQPGDYASGTVQTMVGQHGTENAMNCIPAQLHKAALGPCVREARHAQDRGTRCTVPCLASARIPPQP